ncbi:hypothetical protein DPMN_119483 [Dreissena polymorpha]|uniref:Uncharacterized protein n=1 Tax=Dreissena polymorpha TaxID=45954 RepID=A0A9D4JS02_DREPO|nr:hypothetical protein DPMN_119483 [Dreissena polymorpha]
MKVRSCRKQDGAVHGDVTCKGQFMRFSAWIDVILGVFTMQFTHNSSGIMEQSLLDCHCCRVVFLYAGNDTDVVDRQAGIH